MNIIDAIKQRASTRQFLDKPVPRALITQILDCARWAPSAVNTQPWKIVVLQGASKQQISDWILQARMHDEPERPDYDYYPKTWFEPYKSRRKACGAALYSALDIGWGDSDKRLAAWNRNYCFFDAPIGLLFFLHHNLAKGSWVDMGMFMQNVMVSALHFGLATCPQASLAEYPDIVREVTGVDEDYHLLAGMAIGYPDHSAPVNRYRTERLPVDAFTSWLE